VGAVNHHYAHRWQCAGTRRCPLTPSHMSLFPLYYHIAWLQVLPLSLVLLNVIRMAASGFSLASIIPGITSASPAANSSSLIIFNPQPILLLGHPERGERGNVARSPDTRTLISVNVSRWNAWRWWGCFTVRMET